jgi:ABC-type multidrug transport system fused ATPase/permease subunit
LFEQTTLIPQDPEIFENTIRYNITVGLDVPQSDLDHAVSLANFSDVIKRLPQGLESDIREKGVNLSGGEKQRLALARGLLAARSSSVMLMDEPTSSIDLLTVWLIYRQILTQFKDTTVISSLHRLHLLTLFDRILVLSQGKLVQNGTFEDLLATPGLFRDLWDDYKKQHSADGMDIGSGAV